jgi:hypothetical protein
MNLVNLLKNKSFYDINSLISRTFHINLRFAIGIRKGRFLDLPFVSRPEFNLLLDRSKYAYLIYLVFVQDDDFIEQALPEDNEGLIKVSYLMFEFCLIFPGLNIERTKEKLFLEIIAANMIDKVDDILH